MTRVRNALATSNAIATWLSPGNYAQVRRCRNTNSLQCLLYPPNVRIPEALIYAGESGTVRPTVSPARRQ